MPQNELIKYAFIGIIAYMVISGGGLGGGQPAVPPADNGVDANGECNYAPTFDLRSQDKWDSSVDINPEASDYRINDGPTTDYTSGGISANKGDVVTVLWEADNSTVYTNFASYTVKCGANLFPEDGPYLSVRNTTVTIECFDEDNNKIDDGAANYTIGSGETATVSCRMKLDEAKKGMQHGGVLVAELNGTNYQEENTAITGSKIGSKTATPGAYSVSATAHKTVSYNVDPMMATGYHDFTVYVEAESGKNPKCDTGDITLTLYDIDCYEDSDTGAYNCKIEDEDSSFTGHKAGTETLSVD